MDSKNIVGENIRFFRKKAGLTQEALALRCDLSQGYINQLESGARRYTQKSLEQIVTALNTTVEEMFKDQKSVDMPVVAHRKNSYGKREVEYDEILNLLKELPAHIVSHYHTLLKMECEILKKEQ